MRFSSERRLSMNRNSGHQISAEIELGENSNELASLALLAARRGRNWS
jgi:hypothetical protein